MNHKRIIALLYICLFVHKIDTIDCLNVNFATSPVKLDADGY